MMTDTHGRKISMRVDPQMDAQLAELQAALNLDMSSTIRLAVAMLHKQAQREGWLGETVVTGADDRTFHITTQGEKDGD